MERSLSATQLRSVYSATARRWHTLNMSRTAAIVVVMAIMVAGALGGWYYFSVAKAAPGTKVAGLAPGAGQAPGGDGGTAGAGGKESGTAPAAGGEQATEQPAQCAGPLPEKSRILYTNLPVGKLGEWVSAKNDAGKEALRFKVDLVDTAEIGQSTDGRGVTVPIIAALFSLKVENLSCEDLQWSLQRSGLWLSWRKPHPKDITHAWVSSSQGLHYGRSINVQENGKFMSDDDEVRDILKRKFGRTTLKELDNPLKPNQRGEAEVLILLTDPYRKSEIAPVGLYGDGRLHLALGGELSWALVDLGRAEDWLKQ